MSAFVDEPLLLNELARKAGGLFVSVAATAIGARLLWYTTPTELPQQARESFNGPAESNAIVAFYENRIKTNEEEDSATWQDIIGTFGTNGKFERCHHFIQWLFPTSFFSPDNPGAPLLNKTVVITIYKNPKLLGRFKKSVWFFLGQLGITLDSTDYNAFSMTIQDPAKLPDVQDVHTTMRISRFMRSCCCFSVPQYAWKLYLLLLDTKERRRPIDVKTQQIWSVILQYSSWTWVDTDTSLDQYDINECIQDINRLMRWHDDSLKDTPESMNVYALVNRVLAHYWDTGATPPYDKTSN